MIYKPGAIIKTASRIAALAAMLCCFFQAQGQWVDQASNLTATQTLYRFKVLDANTVWATVWDDAAGRVNRYVRTTDGGANWVPGTVNAPSAAGRVITSNIEALSGTTAWVGMSGTTGNPGRVYNTSDGGQTWAELSPGLPFQGNVMAIHFFDSQTGVMIGATHTGNTMHILRTTNGGATWAPLPAGSFPPLAALELPESVYAVGDNMWIGTGKQDQTNSRVYRSTDRGQTWQAYLTPLSFIFNTVFRDSQNGLISQPGNEQLARTIDGGQTWSLLNYTGRFPLIGLAHVPGTQAYVATGNVGFGLAGSGFSVNDGNHWVALDTTRNHFGVAFADAQNGWSGAYATTPTQGVHLFTGSLVSGLAHDRTQETISVWPNPAHGKVQVSFPENSLTGHTSIQLIDMLGREVLQATLAPGEQQKVLGLNHIPKGVYWLRAATAQGAFGQRLVVE